MWILYVLCSSLTTALFTFHDALRYGRKGIIYGSLKGSLLSYGLFYFFNYLYQKY